MADGSRREDAAAVDPGAGLAGRSGCARGRVPVAYGVGALGCRSGIVCARRDYAGNVAGSGGDPGAARPSRPDRAGPFPAERVRCRRDLSRWATVRIHRPGGRPCPSPGSARPELDRNGRHAGHGGPVAAVLVTRQPVGRVHRRQHRAAADGARHRRTSTDARRNGRFCRRHVGARRHPVWAPRQKCSRTHLSRRGYGRAG